MSALNIPCPKCYADAGRSCIGARGKVRDSLHYARVCAYRDAVHDLARGLDIARAATVEARLVAEVNDLIERLAVISYADSGMFHRENLHAMLDEAIAKRLPRPTFNAVRTKAVIGRSLAKAVFERDAYRCVTCGTHVDLTCDHIFPESKGGETSLDNLQTMCRPCNSSKGSRV